MSTSDRMDNSCGLPSDDVEIVLREVADSWASVTVASIST
jgi:hypothetical protein